MSHSTRNASQRGCSPQIPVFFRPPPPFLEVKADPLQELTRAASLLLPCATQSSRCVLEAVLLLLCSGSKAELSRTSRWLPKGHSCHTGSSHYTGNALLFPATLLAPQRQPVYWGYTPLLLKPKGTQDCKLQIHVNGLTPDGHTVH